MRKQDLSHFYRLWGIQLLREFESICFQYSLSLQPPVFAITESHTQLGSWWSVNREIRISSHLIRNYPWDITLGVVKHEMAHQICSELFHQDTAGHGPSFKKACDILGLSGSFRSSQGDLPKGLKENTEENEVHRILEKIRKLLALAESSNEHEARLAMETAGRLLKKYNIERLGGDSLENYGYEIIPLKRKRIEAYQRRIISILTQFFYVKAICSTLYDPIKNETYRTFEILGRKENVDIAVYCYLFLEKKLSSFWREKSTNYKGNKRVARKSYYMGILQGFHERLLARERASRQHLNSKRCNRLTDCELIVAEDRKLDTFIRARFPRLRKRTNARVKIYPEIYDDGVREGRELILTKAIVKGGINKGNYLE